MVRVKGFELQEQSFVISKLQPNSMPRCSMLRTSSGNSSLLTQKMHQVKPLGSIILLSLSLEGF